MGQGNNSGKVFPDLYSAYKSVKKGEFFVHFDGVMYPFKWDMLAGLDAPMVFFTPGRTIRGKPVPIFQRSSYFDLLDGYNCVSCFDPTLFKDSEINLAWFQGDRKRFYALEIAAIWAKFVEKMQIDAAKILYYGSSGGGIPGFHLAKLTPNSTLYISNVQTDIRNYDSRALKKLVEVSFGGDFDYVDNAGEKQNRFSVNGHSGGFHLVYSQNKADSFHYENHYKKWRRETSLSFFKSVKFIEYDDPDTGHGPLGAKLEVKIIRGILGGEEYDDVYPRASIETMQLEKKRSFPHQQVIIKHSAFPALKATFPIDWNQDPYQSKNWRHHLNSLRWITSLKREVKEAVVIDFYNYHVVKKKKNPYYNTRRGDHAIAIRIGVFSEIRKGFDSSSKVCPLIDELLNNDISTLLREDVYQENNHGLMADVAIIRAINEGCSLSSDVSSLVYKRLYATLSKMYDEEGVCLEHSISYQEYNLSILADIKEIVPAGSFVHPFIDKVLVKSKQVLGSFFLNNGQYIPIGDSFRLPNKKILNKVYGDENPIEAFSPFSHDSGVFYSQSGYFAIRNEIEGSHLSLVSGWNSKVHKQNDELSIFLYHKEHIVFDDPGYTDFKPWDEIIDLKSEKWHSNFWVEGYEWSDVCASPVGSEITLLNEYPASVLAKSSRQKGFDLSRSLRVDKKKILITDTVDCESEVSFIARHQFLLSDVFSIIYDDVVVLLSKFDKEEVARIKVVGRGRWEVQKGKRVDSDRRRLSSAELLVYFSDGKEVEFVVEMV